MLLFGGGEKPDFVYLLSKFSICFFGYGDFLAVLGLSLIIFADFLYCSCFSRESFSPALFVGDRELSLGGDDLLIGDLDLGVCVFDVILVLTLFLDD